MSTIEQLKRKYLAEPLRYLFMIKKFICEEGATNRMAIRNHLGIKEPNMTNKLKELREESLINISDKFRPKPLEITKRGNQLILAILEDILL